jgi:hypothetical protein
VKALLGVLGFWISLCPKDFCESFGVIVIPIINSEF